MADLPAPHRRFFGTPFDLLLLSMAAGSADAAGYLSLGKVFTANMTGNIVLLGIALSEGRGADTWRTLFSLLAFITGTCLGGWMCGGVSSKEGWVSQITRVISCEAILLLAYALFWMHLSAEQRVAYVFPLIALLGLSMGLQGAAAAHLGIPGVVTTVVTGTLTSLFTGLMKRFTAAPSASTPASNPRAPLALQSIVVLTYCAGAAVSGALNLHAKAWAGFFPTTIVVVVLLTRLGRRR